MYHTLVNSHPIFSYIVSNIRDNITEHIYCILRLYLNEHTTD